MYWSSPIPSSPSATTVASQTASFRTYTIGIVTHGGIQDTSWKNGPPWELEMAYMMKQEGYDAVIPYNWVAQSSTPGEAIKQSPRLARIILHAASQFPASDPVNLDFIGHSEGTVVNTYAIVRLGKHDDPTPQSRLYGGYAAGSSCRQQQCPRTAGQLCRGTWRAGQDDRHELPGHANDPPAFIPSVVDEAQVFFEHSQATAGGMYNLWGQVPVKSDGPVVHYYNLTDMGVTHSGKKGVASWYRNFIVPNLGNQAPLVQELQLDGHIDDALPSTTTTETTSTSDASFVSQATLARDDEVYGPAQVVQTNQPEFSGTSAPGSIIRLLAQPRGKALGHHAGRPDHGKRQRTVVAHHQPSPSQWAVSHGRVGLLSHIDDPARSGRYPHPAAGPTGRRSPPMRFEKDKDRPSASRTMI